MFVHKLNATVSVKASRTLMRAAIFSSYGNRTRQDRFIPVSTALLKKKRAARRCACTHAGRHLHRSSCRSISSRSTFLSSSVVFAFFTVIQCSTLCTQRKVTKLPCFWCLVFGAQFQPSLEFFLPIFFATQLALVSPITVTLISSLSVFSLQRTRRFRTRGD